DAFDRSLPLLVGVGANGAECMGEFGEPSFYLADFRPAVEQEPQECEQALLCFEFVLGGVHSVGGCGEEERRGLCEQKVGERVWFERLVECFAEAMELVEDDEARVKTGEACGCEEFS